VTDQRCSPDIVEAVARAICEAEKMNPDDALGGWVHWKEAAVAAIEAMPSPSVPASVREALDTEPAA